MSENTFGYCQNSRRWLLFMDMFGRYPASCPYDGDCDECGYFEEKTATKYLLRKRKLVGFKDEDEKDD